MYNVSCPTLSATFLHQPYRCTDQYGAHSQSSATIIVKIMFRVLPTTRTHRPFLANTRYKIPCTNTRRPNCLVAVTTIQRHKSSLARLAVQIAIMLWRQEAKKNVAVALLKFHAEDLTHIYCIYPREWQLARHLHRTVIAFNGRRESFVRSLTLEKRWRARHEAQKPWRIGR